jgi:hypothetical protein
LNKPEKAIKETFWKRVIIIHFMTQLIGLVCRFTSIGAIQNLIATQFDGRQVNLSAMIKMTDKF